MPKFERITRLFSSFWGQIRWQLTICYLLIGGVSVLLISAFAAVSMNMIVLRSSSAAVERQVDLMAENAATRAEGFAERMEGLLARGLPAVPATPPFRPPGTNTPTMISRTVCREKSGENKTHLFPPNVEWDPPAWIQEKDFTGPVVDDGHFAVAAFVRKTTSNCVIEVLARNALDEVAAGMISRASEMKVVVAPQPPPGTPKAGQKKTFSKSKAILQQFSTTPGNVPIILVMRNWQTGATVDRFVFWLTPDYETVWRQLSRFGQRQSLWIWMLRIIGSVFLLVEIIALWLAIRVTRRIITAINRLSTGALEVGAGNFAYRIPVFKNDQLAALSRTFNQMTESIQHLIEERAERQVLEQEMVLARQVQESLSPSTLPVLNGAQLAARYLPARNISGDFFDVIPLGPDRIGLLCADVSGKGISAALLAASIQSAIRTSTQDGVAPDPDRLLERINEEAFRHIPENRFITLFWADYDLRTRLLRSVNAGHCPALLVNANGAPPAKLDTGGLPIGMFSGTLYQSQEVKLEPGAVLVLYTDGLPEAENAQGEEMGEERLLEVCNRLSHEEPETLAQHILEECEKWSGGAARDDDVTLLLMRAA